MQTFGVITMRLDVLDGGGGSSVARASASTMSNSSSSAAGLVPPIPKPLQPGTEQEVYNLLIIDNHTFEGYNNKISSIINSCAYLKI